VDVHHFLTKIQGSIVRTQALSARTHWHPAGPLEGGLGGCDVAMQPSQILASTTPALLQAGVTHQQGDGDHRQGSACNDKQKNRVS